MIKTKPQSKPVPLDVLAKQPQGPGNTYGTRRAQNFSAPTANGAAYKKPVDNFHKATPKPAGLTAFAPDAAYQARRLYAKGKPHRLLKLEKIEDGRTPLAMAREVKRPSDDAILKFLDRVIQHIPAAGARRTKAA